MSPSRHKASHIGIFEIAWQRPGAQPDASSRRKRFQLAFDFDGVAGHRVPLRAGGGQLPLATSHRRRAKLLGRGDVAARRFRASTRGTRPARTCWNAGEPVGRARPRCVAFTCEDDITSWPSLLVHRWRFQMLRWTLHDEAQRHQGSHDDRQSRHYVGVSQRGSLLLQQRGCCARARIQAPRRFVWRWAMLRREEAVPACRVLSPGQAS